eukprot:SAG11_NODE_35925_length_264_cov_0.915152_1_plen_46_part_01
MDHSKWLGWPLYDLYAHDAYAYLLQFEPGVNYCDLNFSTQYYSNAL